MRWPVRRNAMQKHHDSAYAHATLRCYLVSSLAGSRVRVHRTLTGKLYGSTRAQQSNLTEQAERLGMSLSCVSVRLILAGDGFNDKYDTWYDSQPFTGFATRAQAYACAPNT